MTFERQNPDRGWAPSFGDIARGPKGRVTFLASAPEDGAAGGNVNSEGY